MLPAGRLGEKVVGLSSLLSSSLSSFFGSFLWASFSLLVLLVTLVPCPPRGPCLERKPAATSTGGTSPLLLRRRVASQQPRPWSRSFPWYCHLWPPWFPSLLLCSSFASPSPCPPCRRAPRLLAFCPFFPSFFGLGFFPGEPHLDFCLELRKSEHGVHLWSAVLSDLHR